MSSTRQHWLDYLRTPLGLAAQGARTASLDAHVPAASAQQAARPAHGQVPERDGRSGQE